MGFSPVQRKKRRARQKAGHERPETRTSLRCPHCGYWLDAKPASLSGVVRSVVYALLGRKNEGDLWCWKCNRTVPRDAAIPKEVEVREWEEDD